MSVTNLHNAPRLPHGSSLRNEIRNPTPDNVADPLEVLSDILGRPLKPKTTNGEAQDGPQAPELIANIDFGDLSLEEFVKQGDKEQDQIPDVHSYTVRSIEECMS